MKNRNSNNQLESGNGVIGFATIGSFAIGVISAICAIISATNENYVGAGVCLIAGAISFGLVCNAIGRR